MHTMARNIRKGDEIYLDGTLHAVVDDPRQVNQTLLMIPLVAPGNEYPYHPREIVSILRRSWHQGMVNAIRNLDSNLDPYLEDEVLYVDFGHNAAVLIDFVAGTYVAVATGWAQDGGVHTEHVIVNGEGWEHTAKAVAAFLREQEQHDAALATAEGEQ